MQAKNKAYYIGNAMCQKTTLNGLSDYGYRYWYHFNLTRATHPSTPLFRYSVIHSSLHDKTETSQIFINQSDGDFFPWVSPPLSIAGLVCLVVEGRPELQND